MSSVSHRVCASIAALAVTSLAASQVEAAVLATWAGSTGTWSTENAATAGWTGTLPDGIGDSGTYDTTGKSSATTTQDLNGSRTVGKLEVTGNANASWQVTLASGRNLILNEDGAGAGTAVLSNSMTSTTTGNPALILNGGAGIIFLNDNLLISNTSTSTRSNGSIQIDPQFQGAGNITFSSVSNTVGSGHIALFRTGAGGSNFAGNVNIAKGAVAFNRGDRFSPNPGNVITIGSAGNGSATLAYTGASLGNMENNFVAAADSGGTLVFATSSAATGDINIKSSNTNAASFTLNGDLSFNSLGTGTLIIGNPIVGAGMLTKIGAGPMRVTNTNSYQGGTVVDAGTLVVANAPEVNNGFGFYGATNGTLGSGDVTVNGTAVRLELDTGVTNAIADTATLSLAGGGAGGSADQGYALLAAGIDEIVGALVLGGVAQTQVGTYGSVASGADFQSDEYFSGLGVVTLVPEPTCLALLGLGATGLLARRRRTA